LTAGGGESDMLCFLDGFDLAHYAM
jgi:hypothetical protein